LPGTPLELSTWAQSVTMAHDERYVLLAQPFGSLHRVLSTPLDGGGNVRTLFTLSSMAGRIDVAPDGAIYLDQLGEDRELLQYAPGSRDVTRMTVPNAVDSDLALPLPGGRVVYAARVAGRSRLMVTGPQADPLPMFDIEDDTSPLFALAGPDRLVIVVGAGATRALAIASIPEARILRRLPGIDASGVQSIAATPDGRTLAYTVAGAAWVADVGGGTPRRLCIADALAMDPDGRSIVITTTTPGGVRLSRVPLGGGPQQPLPLPAGVRIASQLTPNAVAHDGRIVVRVIMTDSWAWPAGILDPRTGTIEQLSDARLGSMNSPGWTRDGGLLTMASALRASIWRYRTE
jgi:hypothetical protein